MLNFKMLDVMKARLLKITLSLAMFFLTAGAFAQNVPYAVMTDSSGMGEADTVTVSDTEVKYLPYYVRPDAALNNMTAPYDPTLNSGADTPEEQGIYTSFSWSYAGGADLRYQPNQSNDTVPYVEISFTATGNFDLTVIETSDGGCPGAPVTLPIEVVAEPSFEVTNDANPIEICETANQPIELDSLADNGVSGETLKFDLDSTVYNLNPDLTIDGVALNDVKVYPTLDESNLGGTNVTAFNHDLTVRNNQITQYTFTFNGMSDHVSRKTDFLTNQAGADASFTYYAPSSSENSITYIVYPTPQTGNIYYVPNSFNP